MERDFSPIRGNEWEEIQGSRMTHNCVMQIFELAKCIIVHGITRKHVFSSNSEAKASELLENHGYMFLRNEQITTWTLS